MYFKNTDKLPPDKELSLTAKSKDEGGFYTWEKKIDAATKYMALGNMRLVSELCKIEYRTLMYWRKTPWWSELIEEIKNTRQTEVNTKLSKIVDKSLSVIEDRLQNGDFVMNRKTGEIDRIPVNIKDANTITRDLLKHQIKQEEIVNRIQIQKETVQDQLKLLALEFAKWAKKPSKEGAVDIEFKEPVNALHDQREEGLQEGSGEIYEPPGSDQEEDGAERRSP